MERDRWVYRVPEFVNGEEARETQNSSYLLQIHLGWKPDQPFRSAILLVPTAIKLQEYVDAYHAIKTTRAH